MYKIVHDSVEPSHSQTDQEGLVFASLLHASLVRFDLLQTTDFVDGRHRFCVLVLSEQLLVARYAVLLFLLSLTAQTIGLSASKIE